MADFQTISTFFALLGLAAALAAVCLGLLRVLSPERGWRLAAEVVAPSALALAWSVAAVATLGSLYYSEVVGFEPCVLCWYQRIAMYPLVVLLGVALLRGDPGVRRYVWPLTAVGGLIALGHYVLEWLPVGETALCAADAPCGVALFRMMGFVSLPAMALAGFALIATLLMTIETEI